jgi:hypothetical protein
MESDPAQTLDVEQAMNGSETSDEPEATLREIV